VADRICDDVCLNVSKLDCKRNSINFMNWNTKATPGMKNKNKRNRPSIGDPLRGLWRIRSLLIHRRGFDSRVRYQGWGNLRLFRCSSGSCVNDGFGIEVPDATGAGAGVLASTLEGEISIVDEADSSMSSCGSSFNGTVSVVVDGGSTSKTSVTGSGTGADSCSNSASSTDFWISGSAWEWAARPRGILQAQLQPVPIRKPDHQPRVSPPQVLRPRLEEVAPLALSPGTEMTRLVRR